MIPRNALSPGLYFPFYRRGFNRYRTSKLITGHCTARHILRRSSFSLRLVNRSSFRHYRGVYSLISFIFRLYSKSSLRQSPLHNYICRRKFNLLPTTLSWSIRNTSTLLRLPRRLHHMKHCIIHRLLYFPSRNTTNSVHDLRSLCLKTQNPINRTTHLQLRMTTWLSPTVPYF